MNSFRSFVILNPTSGAGAAGRRWNRIANLIRAALGDFGFAMTRAPNEAASLSRQAILGGYEMIVAVGGDGTLNEVTAGFFDGSTALSSKVVLGVVAAGTGSDFGRTLGQADLESACARLAGRDTRAIDLGFARFVRHDGTPAARIVVNVASFGVGGLVARLVNPRLKSLSGRVAFTLATLRALTLYRDQEVTLQFDGGLPQSLALTNCAFGNGRFFGAGMQVAPAARLDDGEFDVTTWSGFTLRDFIFRRRMLYDGRHVQLKGTQVRRAQRATAISDSVVLLEIDGESVGRLPVELEILPAAIRLKV
jgi:YegS/Rv2252/BmrU family lipid kinase